MLAYEQPRAAAQGSQGVAAAEEWRQQEGHPPRGGGGWLQCALRPGLRRAARHGVARVQVPAKGAANEALYLALPLRASSPGNYIDHKCPFTGNVSIRGRILAGKVCRRPSGWMRERRGVCVAAKGGVHKCKQLLADRPRAAAAVASHLLIVGALGSLSRGVASSAWEGHCGCLEWHGQLPRQRGKPAGAERGILTCLYVGILTCLLCRVPPLQVKSTKMNRTIVVRRDYLHYIKKYQRCAGQFS